MKAFDRENSAWRASQEERLDMKEYSKKYRQFLDTARTERLANKIIRQAQTLPSRSANIRLSLPVTRYIRTKRKIGYPGRHRHGPHRTRIKIVGSHIDCRVSI